MKTSRLVIPAMFAVTLISAIFYVTCCQGIAQHSPATYRPEVWDKTSPAYNAPGAAAERAAETSQGASVTVAEVRPVTDSLPFGALVGSVAGNVLLLLTTIFKARADSQKAAAIQAIHNATPSGASALVSSPEAKATIAKVVGE